MPSPSARSWSTRAPKSCWNRSTLPGHSPEAALAARGVHIISSRDISAPHLESRAFGLYHEQDGVIANLAMPVWGWGKLYEGIVRSILTGAWSDEGEHNADRAMNYYMGMSTDAIDLICSQRLPARTRRLVDLLHERIRAGAFLPFVGPIADQSGQIRVEADVALTPQEIIRMDYLGGQCRRPHSLDGRAERRRQGSCLRCKASAPPAKE